MIQKHATRAINYVAVVPVLGFHYAVVGMRYATVGVTAAATTAFTIIVHPFVILEHAIVSLVKHGFVALLGLLVAFFASLVLAVSAAAHVVTRSFKDSKEAWANNAEIISNVHEAVHSGDAFGNSSF